MSATIRERGGNRWAVDLVSISSRRDSASVEEECVLKFGVWSDPLLLSYTPTKRMIQSSVNVFPFFGKTGGRIDDSNHAVCLHEIAPQLARLRIDVFAE